MKPIHCAYLLLILLLPTLPSCASVRQVGNGVTVVTDEKGLEYKVSSPGYAKVIRSDGTTIEVDHRQKSSNTFTEWLKGILSVAIVAGAVN